MNLTRMRVLWRTAREHAAAGQPCWICGKPIDPALPRNNPMSLIVDAGLLAHMICCHARGPDRPRR